MAVDRLTGQVAENSWAVYTPVVIDYGGTETGHFVDIECPFCFFRGLYFQGKGTFYCPVCMWTWQYEVRRQHETN